MNPISLISNHNPKNQLCQRPLCQSPIQIASSELQVKLEESTPNQIPKNREEVDFYSEEIAKLTYINTVITAQLSSAIEEKKIIMKLIEEAEKRQLCVKQEQQLENQRKIRRSAKLVERKFSCSWAGCNRSYGSFSSLVQHIKLKHPQTNSHEPPLMLDPA